MEQRSTGTWEISTGASVRKSYHKHADKMINQAVIITTSASYTKLVNWQTYTPIGTVFTLGNLLGVNIIHYEVRQLGVKNLTV